MEYYILEDKGARILNKNKLHRKTGYNLSVGKNKYLMNRALLSIPDYGEMGNRAE